MRGRGHRKKKEKKPPMSKVIAVRMDDSLYYWLMRAKDELLLEDMSSTVRLLLKIMQFLTESGQIMMPTKELKKQFEDFIQQKNQSL